MRQATADAVLARIRQLLAKAESTTFEAEVLAFTAKAQELMTRHAIDAALVHDTDADHHDGPISQTFHIDAPYASAKAMLLQTVAQAGRCRAVYYEARSSSSVAGFPDDVAAVELLFTSLLVQAQTASVVAERGDAFLPALRSREQEVEDYYSETFRVIVKPVRGGYDPAGWTSGTLAADTAHLSSGAVRRKSASGARFLTARGWPRCPIVAAPPFDP